MLVELALIRLCQLTDEKKKSLLVDEIPAPIQKIIPTGSLAPDNKPVATTTSTVQTKPVSQPTEKPAENVADNKPAFKRPGRISISTPNTITSPQEIYSEKKAEVKPVLNNPFTYEDLERVWQQFAETIPEQGRMTSFILSTKPNLLSDTSFELTVSNILQEKELIRLQPDIVNFVQLKLQNSMVRMTIKISEETEVQRANTPEDRYKIMADQNPALDKLKNALGLEID